MMRQLGFQHPLGHRLLELPKEHVELPRRFHLRRSLIQQELGLTTPEPGDVELRLLLFCPRHNALRDAEL